MESEAINAATNTIAWIVMFVLQVFSIYAIFQSDRMYNVCSNAFKWSDHAVSAKYDIELYADNVVAAYNDSKFMIYKACLAMIINALMMLNIGFGEIATGLKVAAAMVNAAVIIGIYSSGKDMAGMTRFISTVETEAVLREMKRMEDNPQTNETGDENE